MATWTPFRYGRKHHQIGEFWKPAAGSERGCLIYIQGGGWSLPTTDRVYDSLVGLPVFQDGIEPNELVAGEQMVMVSALIASATYDAPVIGGNDHSPAAWATSTLYSVGAAFAPLYVLNGGTVYRCYDTHTSSAADEPGVGANWADYWEVPAANDIGLSHALRGPQVAGFSRATSRPGFLDEGVLDLLLLIKYLKQNATSLGIAPLKIALIGDSAGGQICGTAAYSLGTPHVPVINRSDPTTRHLAGARRNAAMLDSSVSGVILEITPDDWRNYPSSNLHSRNLFGIDGTSQTQEYNLLRPEQKAALSPLGMLKATGRTVPTFLHYPLNDPGDDIGDETPPWATAKYHHADNGEQIRLELVARGEPNIQFYHLSNLPPDIGVTMHSWLRALWNYPLS